jgi:hypothetical protein
MYCYIFSEIKQQLKETITPEIVALAEEFRQKYLHNYDSIFIENTYRKVLNTLKESLEVIDKNTSIKDNDYWKYYESIEIFLYGDWTDEGDGKIWGISNFHSVWESMCLTHLAKKYGSKSLVSIDSRYIKSKIFHDLKISLKTLEENKKIFRFNDRQLVPDAVLSISIEQLLEDENIDSNYKISYTSWDDYGYNTLLNKNISIGYIGQEKGVHTLEKLKPQLNEGRIVDKPLSGDFYSFWEIDENTVIDSGYLHKMYYFNHLFYLALSKGILDWNGFLNRILRPLEIKFKLSYNSDKGNVFTHSLLREYCVVTRNELAFNSNPKKEENLRKRFDQFIEKTKGLYESFWEIIDIKYLTEDGSPLM